MAADPSATDVELSVVVPVYEEEANVRPFLARLEPPGAGCGDGRGACAAS